MFKNKSGTNYAICFFKSIPFYFVFLFYSETHAEYIRVGIFSNLKSSEYVFIAGNCDYLLTADHKKKLVIKKGESVVFQLSDGLVIAKYKQQNIGKFASIKCASLDKDGFFRLKSTTPETAAIPLPDFLEISVLNKRLNVVNVVDLEKYVSSVVEAEAGDNTNLEFLKVQAIVCRTFALGHLTRHLAEGYQICDNVHCQVFQAKNRFNNTIQDAVEQTRSMVIVDAKHHLITCAFHSNCGGQTADAKGAWSTNVPCLKSVSDTFCLQSPHATWQKSIDRKTWVNYLLKKNFLIPDSILSDSLTFIQTSRKNNYVYNKDTISLKTIRYDFKLKSTWFNILPRGDSLLFQGFGYGHGVGLCQEGAMKMADYGFKMKDIISHYFQDVSLEDYAAIQFSKQK